MNDLKTAKYRAQSRVFLSQAFEELDRGDLSQASEKGWGAASQIIKAVAQERRWYHYSHISLEQIVDRLSRETADSTLTDLFDIANRLHINFYENRYSSAIIQNRLHQVGRFVDRVEGLLENEA